MIIAKKSMIMSEAFSVDVSILNTGRQVLWQTMLTEIISVKKCIVIRTCYLCPLQKQNGSMQSYPAGRKLRTGT